MKRYTTMHLLFDMFMTFITGGLWLIWVMVRFYSSNTRR